MRPPLRLCDVCEARVRARACVGESGRGAAEALRVYAYVVWGMGAELSCGGRGDQVQVYAVGMLMATLRSGDEHRNRQDQDAPSPIGQPYQAPQSIALLQLLRTQIALASRCTKTTTPAPAFATTTTTAPHETSALAPGPITPTACYPLQPSRWSPMCICVCVCVFCGYFSVPAVTCCAVRCSKPAI